MIYQEKCLTTETKIDKRIESIDERDITIYYNRVQDNISGVYIGVEVKK